MRPAFLSAHEKAPIYAVTSTAQTASILIEAFRDAGYALITCHFVHFSPSFPPSLFLPRIFHYAHPTASNCRALLRSVIGVFFQRQSE